MDAAQRLALIRARLRPVAAPVSKPVGIHASANGQPSSVKKNGPWIGTGRGVLGCNNGVLLYPPERRKEWVSKADAPEPAKPCRHQRKARVNPLTRIAQQLPKKLPRVGPDS